MSNLEDLLKLILDNTPLEPDEVLEFLDYKSLRKKLTNMRSTLLCVCFIHKESPISKLIQKALSKKVKEFPYFEAYLVDPQEDQSLIHTYAIKEIPLLIMFKKGFESARFKFEPQVVEEYIDSNANPFFGQSRKLDTPVATDLLTPSPIKKAPKKEPQLQLQPQPKPEPKPKPKPNKSLNQTRSTSSNYTNLLEQTTSNPDLLTMPEPLGLFLNPFSKEYQTLFKSLSQCNYTKEQIDDAVLAGGATFDECSQYLNMRAQKKRYEKSLTYPGASLANLTEEQLDLYQSTLGQLDSLKVLYILIEKKVKTEESLHRYYQREEARFSNTVNVLEELNNLLHVTDPNYSEESVRIRKQKLEEERRKKQDMIYRQEVIKSINMRQNKPTPSSPKTQVTPSSSPKPHTPTPPNKSLCKIKFNHQNKQYIYEFSPTQKIKDFEQRLRDEQIVKDNEDVIISNPLLGPITIEHYEMTFAEKNIKQDLMYLKITPKPVEEPVEEQ